MQTKWIAITAASALGIGSIAAGALSIANAVEIRDAQGSIVASGEIHGDVAAGGPVEIKIGDDHATDPSPTPAPTATTAASAPASEAPASQAPASQPQPPTAVDMPSANTVGSAYSVVEVASAGSPD